jgi:hypothetical protein
MLRRREDRLHMLFAGFDAVLGRYTISRRERFGLGAPANRV